MCVSCTSWKNFSTDTSTLSLSFRSDRWSTLPTVNCCVSSSSVRPVRASMCFQWRGSIASLVISSSSGISSLKSSIVWHRSLYSDQSFNALGSFWHLINRHENPTYLIFALTLAVNASDCRSQLTQVLQLEEASTHKSANTHAGNVFVTLTFWPQNEWVSRTHRKTLLCQVSWSKLHRLLRYGAEKKTDTQTKGGKNPTPATDVCVGNYSHVLEFLEPDIGLHSNKCELIATKCDWH